MRITNLQTYLVLVNASLLALSALLLLTASPGLDDGHLSMSGKGRMLYERIWTVKRESELGFMDGGCDECEEGDTFCQSLGEHNYARSVLYSGTNSRLHRLFDKLRKGKAISVSALGGSVTMGHGLRTADPRSGPLNMHRIVFDHLNETFPHADHSFFNGGQAAQGSAYFNMCFKEHVDESADLILIELAINDVRDIQAMDKYETLLRGVLALPGNPAVIAMQSFGLVYPQLATGGDLHLSVNAFYDVPTISVRNVVLPQIISDQTRETTYDRGEPSQTPTSHIFWFAPWGEPGNSPDVRHFGFPGHDALGRLVNIYLDRTLCSMDRKRRSASRPVVPVHPDYPWQFPQYSDVETLPRLMLQDHYTLDMVRGKIDPTCASTASERHPLTPQTMAGWRAWAWKDKKYIIADRPGSVITFAFTTAIGIVELGYQRSGKYGLGIVDCWVDGQTDKKQALDGYWDKEISIGQTSRIGRDLIAGDHVLTCELRADTHDPKGGTEFRIISLSTL